MHNIAFTRLKQRALDRVIAEAKTSGVSRFSLATGVRYQESRRRMGYGDKLVTRAGAQVWSNPIYYATNRMMADYRTFYDLPKNPVAEHLHISGECLCGCFASPGEFDEIAFFYPRTAERIRGWEQAAKERGCKNWLWGVRHEHGDWMKAALEAGRITEDDLWPAADLCGTCVSRSELIAGIREQGL